MPYQDEYESLLDPYVDGALSPEEMTRVREHLNGCDSCRSYVDAVLAIRAALPEVDDTPVPAGFAEGVMAAIRAEDVRRTPAAKSWRRSFLPLAACFAVAVLALFPLRQQSVGIRQTPEQAAADTQQPPPGAPVPKTAEDVPESAPEEREAPAPAALPPQAEEDAGQLPQPSLFCNSAPTPDAALLTLTRSQVGSLLERYTPVSQEGETSFYQLTAAEYAALLDALDAAGVESAGAEAPPADSSAPVLVSVIPDP